uniref:RING-type E3 ubiquitin transferase n=1 Tax=Leersia perrieri TaxID=77586 RepID=A0A0D9W3Z6_9ORYZ
MDSGCGIINWQEDGVEDDDRIPPLVRSPRRRFRPPPPADPLSRAGALPRRPTSPATSVRTRRSPSRSESSASSSSAAAGGGSVERRSPSARARLFADDVTGRSSTSAPAVTGKGKEKVDDGDGGGGSGGEDNRESFSFPDLEPPRRLVDAAAVVDHFATADAGRRERARGEFLDETMAATAGARMGRIKRELLVRRRVLDLPKLERWLRRTEAVDELAWFTEQCAAGQAPPLDLFEGAFRALRTAAAPSDEVDTCDGGGDRRRFWVGSTPVPEFFLCPISNKVMENPVVISSGMTVDCLSLEKWWSEHRHTNRCPVTDEILDRSILIPNILIAQCITRWRARNGITDVTAVAEPPNISSEEEALFKELSFLAHSPSMSDETFDAILRLDKIISNAQSSFLHLLGRSAGMIAKLACILPETCLDPDPDLDNIILKIIAKTASCSPSKVILGDDQYAIPVLIARALLGPVATRVKCAQILGLLAENYYNKIKIGELGGFAALMELLLLVGDRDIKKTVAMAIASLCEAQENWSRFLREGVADAAISLLRNDNLVDEAHTMLLQATRFELAMTQILEKLMSFQSDDNCAKMIESLWNTFIRSKVRRELAGATHASSEISSDESVELPMDNDLTEQTKKDVKTIVSWLQKKSRYPRTYRY